MSAQFVSLDARTVSLEDRRSCSGDADWEWSQAGLVVYVTRFGSLYGRNARGVKTEGTLMEEDKRKGERDRARSNWTRVSVSD